MSLRRSGNGRQQQQRRRAYRTPRFLLTESATARRPPSSSAALSPIRSSGWCDTRARIRNLVRARHRRRDELERVAAHVDIGDGRRDLRHVAFHAFTAAAAGRVFCMRFDRRPARAVRRVRPVARQAKLLRRLDEIGVVIVPCTSWQLEQVTPLAIHRRCPRSRFPACGSSARCLPRSACNSARRDDVPRASRNP